MTENPFRSSQARAVTASTVTALQIPSKTETEVGIRSGITHTTPEADMKQIIKSCFGYSLRSGSLAIGIFNVVGSATCLAIWSIVMGDLQSQQAMIEDSTTSWWSSYIFLTCVTHTVFGCILVHGTLKGKLGLLQIWLVYYGGYLVLNLIVQGMFCIIQLSSGSLPLGLFGIANIGIGFCCFAVVESYFVELSAQRRILPQESDSSADLCPKA